MSNDYAPEDYRGPKEFVHLHNHTVFSALDGVATPEQYAEQCAERGYPAMSATEHGHMASVPDMYLAFRKHGVKYVPGCFLKNQPVLIENGVIDIGEIVVGDNAFTHKHQLCNIKNTQVRSFDGDLVRIKAWCVEDQLCTPEHPFYVREVVRNEVKRGVWEEDISIGWRKASELFREKYHRTYDSKRSKDRTNKRRYRFYLCVPRPKGIGINGVLLSDKCFSHDAKLHYTTTNAGLPDIIDSVSYEHERGNGKIYRTTKNVNLPATIDLDEDLLWIMGLWLAEGTIKDGLHFHLCANEYCFYERIADYFARFGINTSYNFRNSDGESRPREALDVSVYSTYFGKLFESLFGKHFDQKKLPSEWLMKLSREQSKHLLDGLFDGDAKIGNKQSYLKLNNRTLVWQARVLLSAIGQYSAVSKIPCNNSDNMSYCIRRRESGHFYYDYDDEYVYLPVYDIDHEKYVGDVYNLEVEEDNSYNVGVAVHNCEIYFNDYEPTRRKLASQGIKVRSPEWRKNNPELAARIGRNRHLTVLCKNETGYHNLLKLTTQAYETGLFGMGRMQFNRIWFDKLCEFKEGLIVLSGCLNGPIAHELRYRNLKDREGEVVATRGKADAFKDALSWVKKFHRVFGDDYFFELQMPGIDAVDKWGSPTIRDEEVFRWSIAIADQYKIPMVLTNDCWNPEVFVQTNNGSKQLCELRPGDLVWTHRNRLREVVCVGKRKVKQDENLYGFLGSDSMVCTENHKLYSKSANIVAMRRINDLSSNDFIHVAAPALPTEDKLTVNINEFIKDPRLKIKDGLIYPCGGKSINPIPNVIELTDELLWIIGIYIAEGSVDAGYRLGFAGNDQELLRFERINNYFSQFGFSPSKIVEVSEKGRRMRICSSGFSHFFGDCGKSPCTKRLPSFWTNLSERQLRILLRGYVEGDGCISRKNYFTTSLRLFTDLMHAFAALNVGVTPQLRKEKEVTINKKGGRKVKTWHKEGYTGSIGKTGLAALGLGEPFDASKVRSKYHIDDDGVWIQNPFIKIEHTDLKEVWCIQVENDHSFQVGVSSGNCHYLRRKDFELQKLMMAVAQGTTMDSPDLFHVNSSEQFMKTRGELWSRFKNNDYSKGVDDGMFEAMCDNTLLVAERCEPLDVDTSPKIPEIANADDELRKIVAIRLKKMGLHKDNRRFLIDGVEVTYMEQAKIELNRFIDKGFSSYFLITRNLVTYGKNRGWPFSPRGCSIPGSKVKTRKGERNIEELEVGEVILDGFGDTRKIENKFVYNISEELVEIKFRDRTLVVTRDHKFYVVRDGVVMLLKVFELKDTDKFINIDSDSRNNHEDISGQV